MWFRQALAPPRQLLVVFAVTLIPGVTGVWLTWRLIEQDRSLGRQRTLERLESAADRLVAATQQSLARLQKFTSLPGAQAPEHTVLVVAQRDSIQTAPPGALPYLPILPAAPEASPATFAEAEKSEFQLNDPTQAIQLLHTLARHPDPAIRAGAFLRLGRTLRKTGQLNSAIEAYHELSQLASTRIAALPSPLLALEALCTLLEQAGRQPELLREATLYYEGLSTGRWPLLRAQYRFHIEEARRWAGGRPETESERVRGSLAGALDWLWHEWRAGSAAQPGQKFLAVGGRPVLLAWQSRPDGFTALLAGPEYLQQVWQRIADSPSVRLQLVDAEGNLLLGAPADGPSPQVVRTSDVTGLPWVLRVSSAHPDRDLADVAARRRLFLGGFALTMLVLAAATWFSLRAISREVAVARLQSDFVAAVSHEFRTPLTAVRQFSEMFLKGRVPSEEMRHHCYEMLDRESERLQTLVEDLLDFGRFEGGRYRYRFAHHDAAGLVRGIVSRFQEQVAPQGVRIELEVAPDSLPVLADGEALGRAIWNLLDNAVKYSPDSRTVRVELKRESGSLAILVRDRGIGIPLREHKAIFEKFVRGSNSQQQFKGTGIGLAMVRHIVQAHRGRIRVESRPDLGSTFTVLLPLARPA